MENAFKYFDKFLRYYMCGAVFLLTIFYSTNKHPTLDNIEKLNSAVLLLIPLIPGCLIYTIHRNLFNPLIEQIRRIIYPKIPFRLLSNREWNGMLLRWNAESNPKNALSYIRDWGSHTQLLYSSGHSIWTASVIMTCIDPSQDKYEFSWFLTIAILLFYITAFFSDIRKQAAEDRLSELTKKRPLKLRSLRNK